MATQKIKAVLQQDKETKRTYRFQDDPDKRPAGLRGVSVYLEKDFARGKQVTVTIEVAG